MSGLLWMGLGNLALALPLALLAWLSGRLLRRPALTHGLWVLVLLKLVTPPIGGVPVDFRWMHIAPADEAPSTAETPAPPTFEKIEAAGNVPVGEDQPPPILPLIETGVVAEPQMPVPNMVLSAPEVVVPAIAPPEPAALEPVFEWPSVESMLAGVVALWFTGAVLLWLRVLIAAWRFERLLKHAPRLCGPLRKRIAGFAKTLCVPCPDIAVVPGTLSPLLWVWGRRGTLVLPGQFFESLDADKQDTLIVHELAHWRRGDHWVRRLECLAGGLYWWCPIAWLAQRGVRQAEEELCDAWVVATIPDSARVYALALVETVDFLAGARPMLPPLASGLGPFPSLQRRLTMIFRTGTPRRLSVWGLCGLAVLGGLLLSWSPTASIAQEEPRPRKEGERRDGEGSERGKKEFKRELKKEFRSEDLAPPERDPRPKVQMFAEELRELESMRQELRARQAELEAKNRMLEDKIKMLKERARVDGERAVAGGPPMPGAGGPGRPGGDVNQRIDALEQKLETILRELTSLRREMGNRGPNAFPPTVPGPGGPGGRGGPGPAPTPRGEELPLPPTQPRKESRGRPGFDLEIEFKTPTPPPAPRGPRAAPPAPSATPLPPAPRESVIPVPPERVPERVSN
jgi:beta-lactamase regulating signal transducer with metallopeptidase domain